MSDVLEIDAEITESVGGEGGVAGYSYLPDKPQINGVTLVGDKSGDDLGLVNKETGKGLSEANYTQAEKTKLAGIAAGAEVNVQADWNQTSSSADDFIKNKPAIIKDILVNGVSIVDASLEADIPIATVQRTGLIPATWMDKLFHIEAGAEVNVQSDWNQTLTNADDYIKNKPNLAAVATSGSYSDLSNKPKISDIQNDAGYVSHLSQLGCAYLEAEDDYAGEAGEGKSFTAHMPNTRQSQYYLESGCMIAVKFPTDVIRAQTSPSVYSAPVIRICTMREPPNYYTSYYPIYFKGEMIPSNQIKADDVALLVYDSDNGCFEHIGYTAVSQFSSTKAGIVPACGVPYSDEIKLLTTSGWQTIVMYGTYSSLNDYVQSVLVNPTLKTINNESLIGSGNITISGGGAITDVELTSDEPPRQHLVITTDESDTYHLPMMGYNSSSGFWLIKPYLLPAATATAQGAMSAEDKVKLNSLQPFPTAPATDGAYNLTATVSSGAMTLSWESAPADGTNISY